MKIPLLRARFCFAVIVCLLSCASESGAKPPVRQMTSPIRLGPVSPEGFNDPAHLYFFRYQAYLRIVELDGIDESQWKKLNGDERNAKIKEGEEWLKNRFAGLMKGGLDATDKQLLAAVWGDDVTLAVGAVDKAVAVSDPAQIRLARAKVQAFVKSIGGAEVDWKKIFDGGTDGDDGAKLPEPLALKKTEGGFLASLSSKEVQAPLESKAAFVKFLKQKGVPDVAVPALDALYEVLGKAPGDEKKETAHILPTVVRFLLDGKHIVNEEMEGAYAYAVLGEYDQPAKVGITALAKDMDPVGLGKILGHEFQHVFDSYAGRRYTLDSELRGFKFDALFVIIMQKDPVMAKKLAELDNSDDEATRGFFHDEISIAKYFNEGEAGFVDAVAFGHGYKKFSDGAFFGRLTLREAVDPQIGIQRQISAKRRVADDYHVQAEALEKNYAEIQARVSSLRKDHDIEKAIRDLANARSAELQFKRAAQIDTLRLERMKREVEWMDKRAAAAGKTPPAHDLSLPVDDSYVAVDQ